MPPRPSEKPPESGGSVPEKVSPAMLEKVGEPVATGFAALDAALGGGFAPGTIAVLGGSRHVGRSMITLQWARNAALAGRTVVYVCHPQERSSLVLRLFLLEYGELNLEPPEIELPDDDGVQPAAHLASLLWTDPISQARLVARVESYTSRLLFVPPAPGSTGIPDLEPYAGPDAPLLIVDYVARLRRTPAYDDPDLVARVGQRLRHVAAEGQAAVLVLVATTEDEIGSGRSQPRLNQLGPLLDGVDTIMSMWRDGAPGGGADPWKRLGGAATAPAAALSVRRTEHDTTELRFDSQPRRFRFDPDGEIVAGGAGGTTPRSGK